MNVNPQKEQKWQARVAALPRQGRDIEIVADERERAEIARAFDLLDVPAFRASVHLNPAGRSGVRVNAAVEADVRQSCVVTLEPVDNHISESFSRAFVLGDVSKTPRTPSVEQAEIIVDLDTDDPPEPLAGATLDLKPVLLEHFALALDPYPRKPGVSAAQDTTGTEGEAAEGPFAALERLKARKAGGKS